MRSGWRRLLPTRLVAAIVLAQCALCFFGGQTECAVVFEPDPPEKWVMPADSPVTIEGLPERILPNEILTAWICSANKTRRQIVKSPMPASVELTWVRSEDGVPCGPVSDPDWPDGLSILSRPDRRMNDASKWLIRLKGSKFMNLSVGRVERERFVLYCWPKLAGARDTGLLVRAAEIDKEGAEVGMKIEFLVPLRVGTIESIRELHVTPVPGPQIRMVPMYFLKVAELKSDGGTYLILAEHSTERRGAGEPWGFVAGELHRFVRLAEVKAGTKIRAATPPTVSTEGTATGAAWLSTSAGGTTVSWAVLAPAGLSKNSFRQLAKGSVTVDRSAEAVSAAFAGGHMAVTVTFKGPRKPVTIRAWTGGPDQQQEPVE